MDDPFSAHAFQAFHHLVENFVLFFFRKLQAGFGPAFDSPEFVNLLGNMYLLLVDCDSNSSNAKENYHTRTQPAAGEKKARKRKTAKAQKKAKNAQTPSRPVHTLLARFAPYIHLASLFS